MSINETFEAEQRRIELRDRLIEARSCLDKYVKSEANAEMMTVVIRTLETLIDGKPTTPMRKHHHGPND